MIIRNLILAATAVVFLAGCQEEANSNSRDMGERDQEKIMQRAVNSEPTYQPTNFLTREAVNRWMEIMDTPSKTFYVYLMGNNGNHIGYYVAQTRPICSSARLTPPDRIERHERGGGSRAMTASVVSAPALDGVYTTGECDSYFFFDSETDAYIEIQGLNFFVSDQPLSIDVEPIKVATQ